MELSGSKNNKNRPLENFYIFYIFSKESFSYILGNGNPEKIPCISGNGNSKKPTLKKLLIFWKWNVLFPSLKKF